MLHVSITPWLRLQQEAKWVNINFERRDLNFLQKIHLPLMILEKFAFSFAFNLRKQNVTDSSFTPLKQTLCCTRKLLLKHCKFLHIASTVVYQTMVAHSTPCLCLDPSLIFSPTKQLYSKVGISGIYRYGKVHSKATYEWHADNIRVHTSDIRMT